MVNRHFFKFLFGFAGLILVGLAIVGLANYFDNQNSANQASVVDKK